MRLADLSSSDKTNAERDPLMRHPLLAAALVVEQDQRDLYARSSRRVPTSSHKECDLPACEPQEPASRKVEE